MQLTRFDRWLRESFVYETHIHTLRPPEPIPPAIRTLPSSTKPASNYPHHYVATSSKAAETLIRQLKDNNQMFTTRIVDRDAWFVPVIAPKDTSFTWRLITVAMFLTTAYYALLYLPGFVDSPALRKTFLDTIKILHL